MVHDFNPLWNETKVLCWDGKSSLQLSAFNHGQREDSLEPINHDDSLGSILIDLNVLDIGVTQVYHEHLRHLDVHGHTKFHRNGDISYGELTFELTLKGLTF